MTTARQLFKSACERWRPRKPRNPPGFPALTKSYQADCRHRVMDVAVY